MLSIARQVRTRVPAAALQAAYRAARRVLGRRLWGDVSLAVVGTAAMRELNRRYRGEAAATDVLSFPGAEATPRPGAGGGEVVICLPVARRQARGYGHAAAKELQVLLVHGILHLCGFTHGRPAQARTMARYERAILGRLGLDAGLITRAEER